MDNISSISNCQKQRTWLSVYVFNVIYAVFADTLLGNYLSFPILITSSVALLFSILSSYFNPSIAQENPLTREYLCGLFDYITFSYLNKLLIQPGLKKEALEMGDVPTFVDDDCAYIVNRKVAKLVATRLNLQADQNIFSKELFSSSAFFWSIFEVVRFEWMCQGFFQFISSLSLYLAPLALQRILLRVASNGTDDDEGKCVVPITVTAALVMLFLGPALKSIGDGQNYGNLFFPVLFLKLMKLYIEFIKHSNNNHNNIYFIIIVIMMKVY